MNELHIYPTSRVLRNQRLVYADKEGYIPTLMRMDEFEKRAILLDNYSEVDTLQRILLLRQAATFDAFKELHIDHSLVRFFTKSDAFFKFFEELSAENVTLEMLAQADAYAEFSTHLQILETLLSRYATLLEERALTDKAFIPHRYKLNEAFVGGYEKIVLHLEGYLSYFELTLLMEIAQRVEVEVRYTTSPFNLKMQERFEKVGIVLPNHSHTSFSLQTKELLDATPNTSQIEAKVYAVEEREEQVALAFTAIEEMVNRGIAPENIVLILPDESFKEHFRLFDRHHNLNFAMGYDYSQTRRYKLLETLHHYWQTFDSDVRKLLERYALNMEYIERLQPSIAVEVDGFFQVLEHLGLHKREAQESVEKKREHERVEELYRHFVKVFSLETMSMSAWLFLWLKALSKVTLDDVRGGLVTVMGVLETRGVSFEGVVIVDFNEGVVPTTSSKDQFLNSQVRTFANLPTKHDREALQKQYYKRLLESSTQAVLCYVTSDNRLPSKFLYELGLNEAEKVKTPLSLLYNEPLQLQPLNDPLVEHFDASAMVWSASRLKTFLTCKRQYYYRYIQKIQAKPQEEMNEGAFLHLLLDHLFREKNSYESLEEMRDALARELDRLLPMEDAKTNYQKLLWKEKLKGFVAHQVAHFKAQWRVVEREEEFQGTIGGLKFKGRIDRIDQNATHTLILDYKSGSIKEAQKTKNIESLNDLQMSIYQQILAPRYSQMQFAFVKLFDGGEIEEIKALEEKNERLFEVIVSLKQTTHFVATKCEELQKCQWCEFALLCERGDYI
jgi:inactivated superfamily I helicase/RecB family exonuclease